MAAVPDNDSNTTKPEPWVLRLGNYLMSKEPSEPMVLRLGNYLQKQPDGISTKETVLNETSEDKVPEREGEGTLEMASKEVRKALTALNQNNHHGGNNHRTAPSRWTRTTTTAGTTRTAPSR